jgi:cell division septation protein DedD
MKLEPRVLGTLLLTAFGVLMVGGVAHAQARKQRPRQVAPTGEEDAPRSAVERQRERQLEQELAAMTSQATEGLVVVKRDNGSETVHLQGRFMSVAVAVENAEGGYDASCHDTVAALEKARHTSSTRKAKPAPAKKPAVLEEK